MSTNIKKDFWIDFSNLPLHKSLIDWKNSIGKEIPFKYDDIEGVFIVSKWISGKDIEIEYLGNPYIISKGQLKRGRLGVIVGKVHTNWRYEIGEQIINDDKMISSKIISRYKMKITTNNHARCYKLQCDYCNQLYDRIENAVETNSCPVCNNTIVVKGVNDLWTTHPHIAQQLKNPEDGYTVTYGARKYFDWICPRCNEIAEHLFPAQIILAKNSYVPCKKCSDVYSFPNKFFYNVLKEIGVQFESEKTFSWSNDRRYDFYFPQFNMIVELHGGQHYDSRFPWISKNDVYKRELAKSNGIHIYIEIECMKSQGEYIYARLVESLKEYFDFSNIDINKISLIADKKIVDLALEYLEKYNFNVKLVADKIGIDRATVSRYLNTAIKANKFDEKIVRECQLQNKIQKHYQSDGKPIRNKETGEVFGNLTQLKKWFINRGIYTFQAGTVTSSIKRENGTSYGYHWEYISRAEFNKIKMENIELAYGDYFENITI